MPTNDRKSFVLNTNAFTVEELERALARESGVVPNEELTQYLREQVNANANNNTTQQQQAPPQLQKTVSNTQYEQFSGQMQQTQPQQQYQTPSTTTMISPTNQIQQIPQMSQQPEHVVVNPGSDVLFKLKKPQLKGLVINSKLNTSPNDSTPSSSTTTTTTTTQQPQRPASPTQQQYGMIPKDNSQGQNAQYNAIPKDSQQQRPSSPTTTTATTTNTPPSNSPPNSRKKEVSELEIPREDIILESEIGKGNFSIVHRVSYLGRKYACKVLNNDVDHKEFLRETSIMARLEPHKNVLQLIGVVSRDQPFMMLTELMDISLLKLSRSTQLAAPSLFNIVMGSAQGLKHLHQAGIVHRDLACRNILLRPGTTVQWEPKISDFGLSRLIEGRGQVSSVSIAGSVLLMAPEALLSRVFSTASDVYSFGIMLCELYGRTEPYSMLTSNRMQIAMQVASGELTHPIPPMCPRVIQGIMKDSFAYNPAERPSMSQIVEKLSQI